MLFYFPTSPNVCFMLLHYLTKR